MMLYILFFILSLSISNVNLLLTENDTDVTYEENLRLFEAEAAKYMFKINDFSSIPITDLKKLMETVQLNEFLKSLSRPAICAVCMVTVLKVQLGLLRLRDLIEAVCAMYMGLTTLTYSDFCSKMLDLHVDLLQHIVDNSDILDPELVCTVLLYNKDCHFEKPALTWTMQTPQARNFPPPVLDTQYNGRPFKILHLSDFHVTMDYEPGSVANCGYPVCCKKNLGNPIKGTDAGYWGDYRDCDTPYYMFEDTLLYLNNTFKDVDLIYYTGDVIDHAVWNSSVKANSEIIEYMYNRLLEAFPGKVILPVIGNHESHPLNVFAPINYGHSEYSQQWLYSLLSKLWSKWLPSEALESVEKQGYYSVEVNSRLRVIALHNNLCYMYNWWLFYSTTFLKQHLTWLSDELLAAEEKGQFVHIIAHVAPGNRECIEPWEKQYFNLISRFQHIIKAQFYGHTHTDELKVFYDKNTQEPFSVGFNGASLTPFSKFNPNIKLVTVNSSNYEVTDIDTYIFNITQANLTPNMSPKWYKLYSMREDFNLPDLSPKSLGQLAGKLFTNSDLLYKYFRFYVRDGDASLKDGCDSECKKELPCKVVTTVSLHSHIDECNE